MKKFKPTKFDVMVLGLTALFLLVTGLYFVVSNGAFCPLCQDYFISNGETYIWDTRGGYLEPLSVYRHCHLTASPCWTSRPACTASAPPPPGRHRLLRG